MSQRAKAGRLLVRKTDKAGRSYIGQNEVIVSEGMFSEREMTQELQRAADEHPEETVVDAEITHYGPRETPPMESNPRHRGFGHEFRSKRGQRQEVERANRDQDRKLHGQSIAPENQVGGFQRAATWLRESPYLRREQGQP